MKSMKAALAAISLLLGAGACSFPIVPIPAFDRVFFSFEGHDVSDFIVTVPLDTILIEAIPSDPDWAGTFTDPDTGTEYPWSVAQPVTLTGKLTPYGAELEFQMDPAKPVTFTVTVTFHGKYGTTVHCLFRDRDSKEIPRTRKHYGIYDQGIRNTEREATGEVTCTHIVNV
jgi:hypothetical protein